MVQGRRRLPSWFPHDPADSHPQPEGTNIQIISKHQQRSNKIWNVFNFSTMISDSEVYNIDQFSNKYVCIYIKYTHICVYIKWQNVINRRQNLLLIFFPTNLFAYITNLLPDNQPKGVPILCLQSWKLNLLPDDQPKGHKTLCASLPRHMLQTRQYLSAWSQMDRHYI